MPADPTARLAAADPVAYLRREADLDAPAPAAVLGRILGTPPPKRPRPKRRLVLAATTAAAVAIVGVLAALPTGDKASLVDRAYAWAPPAAGDGVLFTQLTTDTTLPRQTSHNVVRIWQRGDRTHQFEDEVVKKAGRTQDWHYEHDQTPDLQRTLLNGKVQVMRADDPGWKGQGRATYADNLRPVIDKFRRAYEQAQLRDAGATTFAGRPAHAYETAIGAYGERTTFYVDPDTAEPFGTAMSNPSWRSTTVIDRVETLPATPENLAKLDAPAIDAAAGR